MREAVSYDEMRFPEANNDADTTFYRESEGPYDVIYDFCISILSPFREISM